MAFVEMGPLSNRLMKVVKDGLTSKKAAPLFHLDEPQFATDADRRPIETEPLNVSESCEQDELRSLRDAIHAERR